MQESSRAEIHKAHQGPGGHIGASRSPVNLTPFRPGSFGAYPLAHHDHAAHAARNRAMATGTHRAISPLVRTSSPASRARPAPSACRPVRAPRERNATWIHGARIVATSDVHHAFSFPALVMVGVDNSCQQRVWLMRHLLFVSYATAMSYVAVHGLRYALARKG